MASYPLRGLRVRLAASVAASLVLVLALGATVLYLVLKQLWYAEVDQTLDQSSIAAGALFSTDKGEFPTTEQTVIHIVSELVFGDRTFVAVGPDNRRLAQSRPLPGTPDLGSVAVAKVDQQPTTLPTKNGLVRAAALPLGEGYRLIICFPLGPVEDRLADLRMVLGVGFLLSLLAGMGAAMVASRRVLVPVTEIAEVADRVSDALAVGELPTVAIPHPSTQPDEVGRLQNAFASLLGRLDTALAKERDVAINQRRFFADAAHELRTPIAILRNEIDLALQSGAANGTRPVLERVRIEALHLSNLVGDLLLLARGDTSYDLRAASVIYLDDVVSEVIVRAGRLPAKEGRQITVGRFDPTPVRGDPTLLERAVMALIENALIHAPTSDIQVSVGSDPSPNGPVSWVRVADAGAPIPEDSTERIFERFVRLRQDVPGSGLGLAIVRRIAALHGGHLRLEQNPPNAGKSFVIELPTPTAPLAETAKP